jgi:HEAT repeat protein
MDALEQSRHRADVIPLLVEALETTDEPIAVRAFSALSSLTAGPPIDALCTLWAERRDERLGKIIAQRHYVAQTPNQVRVLSALKASATEALSQVDAESAAHLVAALDDPDAIVRQNAVAVLRNLHGAEAVDTIIVLWMQNRDERLATIISQKPPHVRIFSALRVGATVALSPVGAESVAHLVAALDDSNAVVRQNALNVLENLLRPEAVNEVCAVWAHKRDERLGRVIAQCKYVAKAPLELRLLTASKCGKRVAVDRADLVRICVGLLTDSDEEVRIGAEGLLERVSSGPALEALCDEAIKNPIGKAAEFCVRTGKRPLDLERACLFLFVTALVDRRQLDAYFQEDYEFQNLRLQYDRADATVQGHVMEVVRSGDRRCAGFFGTRSKPLAECTEAEVRLALDSWLRHQEWSRLFQACLELPLKHGLPALGHLRRSSWEPESADLKSLYRQILADGGDGEAPPAKKPSAASTLFEKWLSDGQNGELARLDEGELRTRLASAPPPGGVPIVGALAAKKHVGEATVKAVRESPHWLVRLAGYVSGMTWRLTEDTVQDANYWITELASSAGVLEFWPGKATPADLERLSEAPAEAWAGKLGAARKVLRTIMAHRITTGTFEPMVVEADEFAGEFVVATD